MLLQSSLSFFFFNAPATTEIYTLSLHDALPIWSCPRHGPPSTPRSMHRSPCPPRRSPCPPRRSGPQRSARPDRKSTRLNSSHMSISYAVFCLKKKKKNQKHSRTPSTILHRIRLT